jgi:hypothetical protein
MSILYFVPGALPKRAFTRKKTFAKPPVRNSKGALRTKMPSNKKSVPKAITSAKREMAKKAFTDAGAKSFRKFIEDLKIKSSSDTNFTVGAAAYSVGVIAASYIHGNMQQSVGIEKNTLKRMSGSNNIQLTKRYTTKFEYGRRLSRAMQMLATQNGTRIRKVVDTKRQSQFRGETASQQKAREDLAKDYGFNQKLWLVPGRFLTYTIRQALDLFDLSPEAVLSSARNSQTIYGMCLEEISKTTILNTSTYFPTIVKYRLISCKSAGDEKQSINNVLNNVGNTPNPTNIFTVPTQPGRMPSSMQFSDIIDADSSAAVTPTYFNSLVVDPEATLGKSALFSDNFHVSKTFTKKLMPGDVWEIETTRHTGSGWNLTRMAPLEDLEPINGYAVGLIPLIEFKGITCECASNNSASYERSYIGTSPGWIQMEFETKLKLINNAIIDVSSTVGAQPDYAIRSFIDEPVPEFSSARKFNVPADRLGNPLGAATDFYIPLISDKEVKYAGPAE